MLFRIVLAGHIIVCLVLSIWATCDYCQDISASSYPNGMQLCNQTGASTCGLLYLQGDTACCSNTPSVSCANVGDAGLVTFYYKTTKAGGSCQGIYLCSQSTTESCPGDIIIATSSNCVPNIIFPLSTTQQAYQCQ